ncbi:MAG: SDR family oxidoreductase [Cyclobacteriaceae bacterium]
MNIQQLFNLNGKTAIVTGASKGIGKAMALGLAQAGANVVVSSRKQAAVDEVAKQFEQEGLSVKAIACHVGDEEQQRKLVDQTISTFGAVDVLVNNAATNPYFGPIEEMDMGAFRKTQEINVNAAMQLSNLVYPGMKENGGGSIVHISSIEGEHASPMFAAYNISKASLIMLTKSQCTEWGKDNIRVNAICPGFVKTKLSQALWTNEQIHQALVSKVPLGRMAQPEEMAGLAVFLASGASSYMTGSIIMNDGGIMNASFM